MNQEKETNLRMRLNNAFQKVESTSDRSGYRTRLVIDPESLEELLDQIIDILAED